MRRFGYPPDSAQQDVADLTRLPLQVASTADLAEAALALAASCQITAYDAAYVALARRLALPLVTADEALVRRLAGTDLDKIVANTRLLLNDPAEHSSMAKAINPFGDGHAAERIVDALLSFPHQDESGSK